MSALRRALHEAVDLITDALEEDDRATATKPAAVKRRRPTPTPQPLPDDSAVPQVIKDRVRAALIRAGVAVKEVA